MWVSTLTLLLLCEAWIMYENVNIRSCCVFGSCNILQCRFHLLQPFLPHIAWIHLETRMCSSPPPTPCVKLAVIKWIVRHWDINTVLTLCWTKMETIPVALPCCCTAPAPAPLPLWLHLRQSKIDHKNPSLFHINFLHFRIIRNLFLQRICKIEYHFAP